MWPARYSSGGRTSSTVTSPASGRGAGARFPRRPPSRRALEVLAGDLLDLGEARLGEPAQREEEPADLVVREAVLDVEALLLRVDEARGAEHLQVLREALATEIAACSASASTVRGPWQSRSSSSSRLGAETAFPSRASCS
jgi:hypothetical protein